MGISEKIDQLLDALEQGRDFRIESDEGSVFLKSLDHDFNRLTTLLGKYGLSLDRRRWLSSNLYPLTIHIVNRGETPGARVYVGSGRQQICVVYYGICPELENFVTITMWPAESASSKRTFQQIYSLVKNDHSQSKVISFSGNYGLALPNELHPKVDRSVGTTARAAGVYDWEFAPYLKDYGDTITSHRSPMNFRMIFDPETISKKPVYCNFKTTLGSLLEVRKNEAQFLIPSFTQRDFVYNVLISDSVFRKISSTERYTPMHLLICEKVEANIARYLVDVTASSSLDILGSLASYCIYLLFLSESRLRVLTQAQYSRLHDLCLRKMIRFLHGHLDAPEQSMGSEFVRIAYLAQATRLIDGKLFYVPSFLTEVADDMIKLFDEKLAEGKSSISDGRLLFNEAGGVVDMPKFGNLYTTLRFHIDLRRLLFLSDLHLKVANYLRHAIVSPS